MKGGTISENSGIIGEHNSRCSAVYIHNDGVMKMTGGTIEVNTGISCGGIDCKGSSSTVEISGGSVINNKAISGSNADLDLRDAAVSIMWVVENDILRGYDDGSGNVGPEDATLRSHVVAMMHRLAGEPEPTGVSTFGDVSESDWHSAPFAWAQEIGLMAGYDDGSGNVGPSDVMTREQMAVVLYRFAIIMGCDVESYLDTNILSYEDAQSVSDWAVEAMQWAIGAGIIEGYDNGSNLIGPNDPAERAHFAAMLMRMDDLYDIL